jgi:hypothetical protein
MIPAPLLGPGRSQGRVVLFRSFKLILSLQSEADASQVDSLPGAFSPNIDRIA